MTSSSAGFFNANFRCSLFSVIVGQLLGICIKLSLAKYEVLPKLRTLDSRIRESRNHWLRFSRN